MTNFGEGNMEFVENIDAVWLLPGWFGCMVALFFADHECTGEHSALR
jgi:hypothetical protein